MSKIEIRQGVAKKPEWSMRQPVDFVMDDGEHIAVTGRNGAGKTMFVDMLTGRHPLIPATVSYQFTDSDSQLVSDNIKYMAFRDTYGGDNDRTYFLQQRWNQTEIDDETPTAGEKLEEAFRTAGNDTPSRRDIQRHLYRLFHMEQLLDKRIVMLSSGELRKLKLTSALFARPKILIMDNPFIGLDAESRQQLKDLLAMLVAEEDLQLILVLSKSDEIPDFITHVVEVKDMVVGRKMPRAAFAPGSSTAIPAAAASTEIKEEREVDGEEVISFNRVTIRYGERTILKDLDWTVRKGEHWVLSGRNGSGKSTLLSLVCADNPQGYACDISLFGYRRGSGESIWDIKRRIGYVSPEMHRAYHRDLPAIYIVASGLKDTVGLYVRPTEEERQQCRRWMERLGIAHLEKRSFTHMSSGEQRLVLLARAFVKEPELLILDEPLHGLDNENRRMVKGIIEEYFRQPEKTLIFVSHYQEEWPPCIDHWLTLTPPPATTSPSR